METLLRVALRRIRSHHSGAGGWGLPTGVGATGSWEEKPRVLPGKGAAPFYEGKRSGGSGSSPGEGLRKGEEEPPGCVAPFVVDLEARLSLRLLVTSTMDPSRAVGFVHRELAEGWGCVSMLAALVAAYPRLPGWLPPSHPLIQQALAVLRWQPAGGGRGERGVEQRGSRGEDNFMNAETPGTGTKGRLDPLEALQMEAAIVVLKCCGPGVEMESVFRALVPFLRRWEREVDLGALEGGSEERANASSQTVDLRQSLLRAIVEITNVRHRKE